MEENSRPPIFVNVHSLGKFAFCPRAGVLAHEQKANDQNDEEAATPRLNYLPLFDIELIRNALDETKLRQKVTVIVLSILAVVIWLTYSLGFLVPSFLLAVVAFFLVRKGLIHFEEWRELNRRIERYDSAKEARLGNPEAGPRQINWWALLRREEFTSDRPAASLRHPDLHFGGEPARVATFQRARIPVILHHKDLDKAKDYHIIRLAAYAILLDRGIIHGKPVCWGIILHPATMTGIALPLTEDHKQKAREKLSSFRKQLIEVENGTDPLPAPEHDCHGCPYGRPRVFRRGLTETRIDGKELKPRLTPGNDRRKYHCPCGDRFGWIPPHELAIEKGLKNP